LLVVGCWFLVPGFWLACSEVDIRAPIFLPSIFLLPRGIRHPTFDIRPLAIANIANRKLKIDQRPFDKLRAGSSPASALRAATGKRRLLPDRYYTLNLNSSTSPSCTTYSLSSIR